MKDRLFRRRGEHEQPPRHSMNHDDWLRGPTGAPFEPGQTRSHPADVPWDHPTDDGLAGWPYDSRAGEAAWDRPSEDEFAPPLPQTELHWAFHPPLGAGESAAAIPGAGDSRTEDRHSAEPGDAARMPEVADVHWALRESGPALRFVGSGYAWEEGAPLVSVPRTDAERPPRDPAQAGMFDPDDAFAPGVQTRLPTERSAPVAGREGGARSTDTGLPRAGADATHAAPTRTFGPSPGTGSHSVFGDLFGASGVPAVDPAFAPSTDFATAGSVADPAIGAMADSVAVPPATPVFAPPVEAAAAPTGQSRADPLEWPPIPVDLLPPLPHGLVGPETPVPATEPDGRRFAWPPPQPLVSPEPATGPEAAPISPEDSQQQFWPARDRAAGPPTAERQAALARHASAAALSEADQRPAAFDQDERPAYARSTLLTVLVTAVVVIGLVLLFTYFVAPLLR